MAIKYTPQDSSPSVTAIDYEPQNTSGLVSDPAEGGSFSASNEAELAGAQSFAAQAAAQASAAAETLSTLQSLQAVTGPPGSNASYNPETGVLTVPRGDEGDSGADTANEILTKLLTVDGTTSNLDADKLDGQDGSYYLNTSSELDAGSF